MASKEKRGKLPSIPLKEIGGFLDYNFNSCWGCGTELKVEGYVEDPDDLESRLDENTGITCWILRLRRALVHGGAKHDNGNRLPICFDCYLSGKDGTRRITLPGYMWRRLDIMCDHVKSVEGWEDTPTKAIQRAVIESSIGYYEPFRLNFNPVHPRDEEPAQTFVFEVDGEVFDGAVKRNLGMLAQEGKNLTAELRGLSMKISGFMSEIENEMEELQDRLLKLLPEESEDIFLRTVHQASNEYGKLHAEEFSKDTGTTIVEGGLYEHHSRTDDE